MQKIVMIVKSLLFKIRKKNIKIQKQIEIGYAKKSETSKKIEFI